MDQRGMMRRFLCALTLALLAGCSSESPPAPTVETGQAERAEKTAGTAHKPAPPKKAAADRESPELAAIASSEDSQHPRVRIQTSLGDLVVELNREKAPVTVDNFLEYADQQHYDGTIIHQVVKGYVVMGGGFTSELIQKPTRTPIRNEAHNGLSNRRGTIAMARHPGTIDSATNQFFVNLSDNPALDHKDRSLEGYGYCVFGTVVDGLDILDRIAQVKVHDTDEFELIPEQAVEIRNIRRISNTGATLNTRVAERNQPHEEKSVR